MTLVYGFFLFIDIIGVLDVYTESIQPGLHGQQGTITMPR